MMHEGAMITIQAIGDDQEPHELARAIMLEIDDAVARRALGEG